MNLSVGESDKGWMGEFNKTLRSRMIDRTRSRGFLGLQKTMPMETWSRTVSEGNLISLIRFRLGKAKTAYPLCHPLLG